MTTVKNSGVPDGRPELRPERAGAGTPRPRRSGRCTAAEASACSSTNPAQPPSTNMPVAGSSPASFWKRHHHCPDHRVADDDGQHGQRRHDEQPRAATAQPNSPFSLPAREPRPGSLSPAAGGPALHSVVPVGTAMFAPVLYEPADCDAGLHVRDRLVHRLLTLDGSVGVVLHGLRHGGVERRDRTGDGVLDRRLQRRQVRVGRDQLRVVVQRGADRRQRALRDDPLRLLTLQEASGSRGPSPCSRSTR